MSIGWGKRTKPPLPVVEEHRHYYRLDKVPARRAREEGEFDIDTPVYKHVLYKDLEWWLTE